MDSGAVGLQSMGSQTDMTATNTLSQPPPKLMQILVGCWNIKIRTMPMGCGKEQC